MEVKTGRQHPEKVHDLRTEHFNLGINVNPCRTSQSLRLGSNNTKPIRLAILTREPNMTFGSTIYSLEVKGKIREH